MKITKSSTRPNEAADWRSYITDRIIGQPEVAKLFGAVAGIKAGLTPPRPLVYLLSGPTGVGKTRTAEVIGEVLHGATNNRAYMLIDCGTFTSEHEVAKLVGAPPGYLGHRETPALFAPTRIFQYRTDKCPYVVVLLDEIEKAHPAFHRYMLQLFDKGTMQLGDNNTTDLTKSLILMSTNLGAQELAAAKRGFGFGGNEYSVRGTVNKAAGKFFAPEFLGRITDTLYYQPLSPENQRLVVLREFARLKQEMLAVRAFRGGDLLISGRAISWLTRADNGRRIRNSLGDIWLRLAEAFDPPHGEELPPDYFRDWVVDVPPGGDQLGVVAKDSFKNLPELFA